MAFSLQQQTMRSATRPCRHTATTTIVASSSSSSAKNNHNNKPSPAKASLAAAGAAAILLASSSPGPALAMSTDLAARVNIDPVAVIAAETAAGPGDKGLFTKLLDSIPSIYPKVNEDPFGADRAQEKTIADTKQPIAIPTEQEAVAPEAFPNPSEAYSPRPPVLAAAEGDEHQGENAGQFKDLDASGRQELIDKKSPAQASRSNN